MTRPILLLICAAIVLLVALPPLLLPDDNADGLFVGSDQQATKAISALAPDYQPWASPLWQPPSAEVESLLFALQAAFGAGVLGFCLGRRRGGRQQRDLPPPAESDPGRRCG